MCIVRSFVSGFAVFLFLIISVTCRASGTGAAPDEYTELWYGSVLTASFRVAVCVKPDGALRGVVYLKPLTGDVDVYHIYGHLENNCFRATHSSGHLFTGRLTGPDTMQAKIRLSSGKKLSLEGRRKHGVKVTSDCAPLDN